MKTLLLLTSLILSNLAESAQAADPSSYRETILHPRDESVLVGDLGRACVDTLRKLYGEDRTFKSEYLRELIQPLKTKVPDSVLYQRSKSIEFSRAMNDPNVSAARKIQGSLYATRNADWAAGWLVVLERKGDPHTFRRFGWKTFFTAIDTDASTQYGPYLTRIGLSEDATILVYNEELWGKAIDDLKSQFPELETVCDLSFRPVTDLRGTVVYNSFIAIMGEEMGVDVLDYNQGGSWYMLQRPDHVVSVSSQ